MPTTRLEAFSDGVLAILITVMVLELKLPHGSSIGALHETAPVFCAYALSFIFIGIYWNNHHHMFQAVEQVSGSILWANLHLLFWLSLVPFCTDWMGEDHLAPVPTAAYGIVLMAAGVAYLILQQAIIRKQGDDSKLRELIGRDLKGKASAALYAVAVLLAFVHTLLAQVVYVFVAGMWLIPDRRIESKLAGD
jgi:uncharacterized membrane protein